MRIAEKTFRRRKDEYGDDEWVAGKTWACGCGFFRFLKQFDLPSGLKKVTVAAHTRPSEHRVPGSVYQSLSRSCWIVRPEGCGCVRISGKTGHALKPFDDKQVYLQVEYEA